MASFNFDKIAESYDNFFGASPLKEVHTIEQETVEVFLDNILKGKLLDIVCGTGRWTKFFVKNGFKCTGIDISNKMLSVARAKSINAKWVSYEGAELPYDDDSFDVVSAMNVFEHADELYLMLDEIYRVLKPGGYLIASCMNQRSVIGTNRSDYDMFEHAKFFSKDSFTLFLSSIGEPEITGAGVVKQNGVVDDLNKNLSEYDLFDKGVSILGYVKKEE
mgnify:CR=1 FL=1